MSAETQSSRIGHESNKLPLKAILWCLAGFIATAIVIHLVLIGYGTMLGSSYKRFGRIYQIQPNQVPQYPSPALQSNPSIDLQTYRSRAEHELNTYGWIDRGHGIVKIPIERAMDLLASRGLPVRPSIQNGPTELDMQKQKAAADSANAVQQQPRP
jgi:hypothetical protein